MQSKEASSEKLTRVTALNSVLVRLAHAAHLRGDVSQALLLVLDLLLDFGGFDYAEVFLYEVATQTMHGVWTIDDTKLSKRITHVSIPLNQIVPNHSGYMERDAKPYVLHGSGVPGCSSASTTQSWDGATLMMAIAGQLIGCLRIQNSITHRPIYESDITELVPFAVQAALVVSHSTISADHDSNIRRLMRMLDVMPSIADSSEDCDSIYRTVRDAIAETCGFDRVCFFAVHGQIAYGTWGTDEHGEIRDEHEMQFPIQIDNQYMAPFADRGRRFVIDTIRATLPNGTVSYEVPHAYIPLWSGAELIGIVAVDNLLTMRAITPAMTAPVLAICDQAAVALQKAKLLSQQETVVP